MLVETMVVGFVQTNCYLAWNEATKEGFLVDPGDNAPLILDTVRRLGVQVKLIFLTHSHFDHIMGLSYIYNAYCITPRCHPAEQEVYEMMPIMAQKYFGIQLDLPLPPLGEPLREGNVVELGQIRLHVIHTPGHTPGGICLHEPYHKVLFSGDTLFRGSLGRTDLGGNMVQELSSIRNKILTLPTDTRILPGHGPETDVAWESNHNPYLC